MERTILHVDMNNFYASVECLDNPSLCDKPIAVGGDARLRHGIILAKNQIAKSYGVKTAEALWEARRKCPKLIVIQPRFDRYVEYSQRSREILGRYSDRVEPYGLDEAWIDISPYARTESAGREIADQIRECYKSELGLTVSIGVSFNKAFAKLGSDMKKPDATTVIPEQGFDKAIWSLPVEDLLFVGASTERKLKLRGIYTIGQLAMAPAALVHDWLGANGDMLRCFANGQDKSPVMARGAETVIKSIGNSVTPPRDIVSIEDATAVLQAMAECVATRLRRNGLRSTTVALHVRSSKLVSFERQMRLERPTCLAIELRQFAVKLLRANWDCNSPLRSLGVRAAGLVAESDPIQLSIFDNEPARLQREKMERAIDRLRDRYGKNIVALGAAAYAKELGKIPDFDETPFNECAFYTGD